MNILDYIDGDVRKWSVDLAGFRSQFPDRTEKNPHAEISDLQALQRGYIEKILRKEPERFRRTAVVIDTIMQVHGDTVDLLSLDPQLIMNDDEIRAMLINRDPHSEGRAYVIAHATRMAIQGGLSYELYLTLQSQRSTDEEKRQQFRLLIESAARIYRKNHPNDDLPENLSELIARIITHDIVQEMQNRRIKPVRRAKTA